MANQNRKMRRAAARKGKKAVPAGGQTPPPEEANWVAGTVMLGEQDFLKSVLSGALVLGLAQNIHMPAVRRVLWDRVAGGSYVIQVWQDKDVLAAAVAEQAAATVAPKAKKPRAKKAPAKAPTKKTRAKK